VTITFIYMAFVRSPLGWRLTIPGVPRPRLILWRILDLMGGCLRHERGGGWCTYIPYIRPVSMMNMGIFNWCSSGGFGVLEFLLGTTEVKGDVYNGT